MAEHIRIHGSSVLDLLRSQEQSLRRVLRPERSSEAVINNPRPRTRQVDEIPSRAADTKEEET